jgi:subtilase family serine protease
VPPARIQVITSLAGSSGSPWLAGVEEVEDTELVHAVAPDATIREVLVDRAGVSTPAEFAATFASYVRIAVRKGEVMSQSGIGQDFNVGEDSWTNAEVATINSALEYAAARHVTVVVASGDYGAIGNGSSTPVKDVSLPASDPLALAAGGTSLTANPVTGAYISETAWNTGGPPSASGGGFSHLFARPAYQNGVPGIGAGRVPALPRSRGFTGHLPKYPVSSHRDGCRAEKPRLMGAFERAAEGARTLDLLHGKRHSGGSNLSTFACKSEPFEPSIVLPSPAHMPANSATFAADLLMIYE